MIVLATMARDGRCGAPALTACNQTHVVPGIFELELCKRLMAEFREDSACPGPSIGWHVEDGVPCLRDDPDFRIRRDGNIPQDLLAVVGNRIQTRLLEPIREAFGINALYGERLILACYDAADGAHLGAHTDNNALAVAHRRVAVTINLNPGEYVGGQLKVAGQDAPDAAPGDAILFPCSTVHEVTPVTQGRRFVFLAFMYDEAGKAMKSRNREQSQAVPTANYITSAVRGLVRPAFQRLFA